jgi:uncharacterized protein YdbL (DUF1318 family)
VSLSSGEVKPTTSLPPDARPTQDPSRTTQSGEWTRWRYGLFAVMAAVTVILVAFVFAALRYNTANDVSTALAAITGTVGTILGGYLGVQSGSQGKEESEAARQKAEARAVALAAAAPYEQALEALAIVEGRPVPARTPGAAVPGIPTARSGSAVPVQTP